MFGTRWRLFRLMGIPIAIDSSWFLILALLTWTLGENFHSAAPDLNQGIAFLMGMTAAVAFFGCIVLHELGHAVVARTIGIPVRGITLFLFGGVAEMKEEPFTARGEFLMAIAGPAVSAVLAGAFWLLGIASEAWGWPSYVTLVLGYLAFVNVAVLIFNLLPAFPLDGGRVLRSILWAIMGNLRRATWWAALFGQGFAWLLIALGAMSFFAGNILNGIWLVLIGLFLKDAARGSYRQVVVRQMLQGEPVSRFMNPQPIVVPPDLDLRDWVEDYVYRYHRKLFPVASNGHVEGFIGPAALAKFPREEWDRHTVAEAMDRDADKISISSNADALQALTQMQNTGSSRLLVKDGDRLVGVVSIKDLLRFLDLKAELEEQPR
jgi:Zn-dependent protease/CBS domain-containing protein